MKTDRVREIRLEIGDRAYEAGITANMYYQKAQTEADADRFRSLLSASVKNQGIRDGLYMALELLRKA
jgi:hypothetical protein